MRQQRGLFGGVSPLWRLVAGVLLAVWFAGVLLPSSVDAAFASTDVVLVVDTSDSMAFPSDIPQDFPNREEYRRAITLMISTLEKPEAEWTVRDLIAFLEATAQLGRLADDIDAYLQTNNLVLEDLSRLSTAQTALNAYLDLVELGRQSGGNDRISLVTFDSSATTNQALGTDVAATRRAVAGLATGGGTNIGAGLQTALDQLARNPAPAGTRQQIILVTGGFATEGMSNAQILAGPAATAKSRNIPIYTVGLGIIPQIVEGEFLADLASATGGAYLFADSPDKLAGTLLTYQGYNTSRVLAKYDGEIRAGQSLRAGSVQVPSGSQSLRMAYRSGAGTGLDVSLTQPGGKVLTKADLGTSLKKQGETTIVTIDNPPAGQWEVNLTRTDAGQDLTRYTLTASTEGQTSALPIALVSRLYESSEGWRPTLIFGTVVIGGVLVFYLYLTFRGLFKRDASTLGGCCSGCFTVLFALVIAVGWGGYWLWNQPFRP
jgi:Mg-chelatase subunit ChlD